RQQRIHSRFTWRKSVMKTLRNLTVIALGMVSAMLFTAQALAQAARPAQARNVVLVHGAWADGSSWAAVIARLQATGLHVTAVQNPGLRVARHNPHRGRACSSADHWTQVRATTVLRSVRFVDAVAGGAADRLEGNLLCHPRGDDSPRLLLNGRLIPTGLLPVVSTHVEGVINYDGPNPCRS